ncbi:PAS domain S-box-containing protein [Halopelagius inordinatus]|uniref:PAS domain S-box-containing protein n=1 Tax=Halopelagius inordinatus TaxID=553467 RepID=A0A1I2NP58_9EURY|nr:PAS domain S-box protein [Halopelagius inordinatus]SFG04800.1 PAS domain S-box-containing protein [Halopelagius inordinatus]
MANHSETTPEYFRPGGGSSGGGQRFEALADSLSDGVYELDAEDRFVAVNDVAVELSGYRRDEILGEHVSVLFDDDGVSRHEDAVETLRTEEHRIATLELFVETARGETVPCELQCSLLRTDGAFDGTVGVLRDATEDEGVPTDAADRTRVERSLRQREAELRSMVDAAEEYAFFRLDAEGYVESWNAGVERIGGYECDEIIGEHVSTFYTDDAVEDGAPERSLADAAKTDTTTEEGWRVRKDGSRFWAEVTRTAIRDDDGEIEGYATVIRDMSERRERERQLREERDLRNRVFETSPVGIVVFDPEGSPVEANDRVAELFDVPPEAFDDYVLGDKPLFDEEGDRIEFELRPAIRVIETGESVSDQRVRLETRAGGTRWLSINATPLTDDDGTLSYVVATVTDVTQIEEQTRRLSRRRDELESELADVFDRVTDAFYALDGEWRFTHVNERAEELLAREEPELLGSRIWDEFENAANSSFREECERAMATQEPSTFEHYSLSLETWFEVRAYPSETGLSVYFQDIGDRKERQQELEEYETIVETVEDGVCVFDEDGRFSRVNRAYTEITGYDREELVGSHYSLVVDPKTDEEDAKFESAIDASAGGRMEFELLRRDGSVVPAESTYTPLGADGDEHRGVVGVVRDVSDRRERQRELERYEQLVETVWDGIYALDPDGRIVLANEAFCDLTGYDRGELLGQSPTLITSESVNRAANELQAEMIEDPERRGSLQFDIFRKGGETVPVEARFGPYDYSDDRYGRCGVVRDVTDRKQFEEALTALHESSRAFLNAVSDEDVGDIIVDAATDVLDLSGVAVYRYDETDDRLVTDATSVKPDIGTHEFPDSAARDGSLVGHIFTDGEAQYYEDIRDAPVLQVDRRRTSIRNAFGVPMGDYGVLVVGSTETGVLDDRRRELVEVLAANAEAAYARVEHEDELHGRVRQQNVVAELGQRALSNRDTDALLNDAVEAVAETLDMEYCEVFERHPADDTLRLKAGVGWDESLVGSATIDATENSQVSHTLYSQNPVAVEDADAESRFADSDLLTDRGVTSGITVSIGPRDDPWGVLAAHDTDRRSFTERDARFLQSVAYVLSAAIDRRTRERELVSQRTELQKREEALRNAHETIADPSLSFAERIDDLLVGVRKAVGTEYATFSRVQDGEHVFEAIEGPDDSDLRVGDPVPLEQRPNCEHVVVNEQTLVFDDVASDVPESAAESTLDVSCYLGAPVVVGGEVYGTLCFYGTDARDQSFSDWEVTFVDILSNWVGNELERKRDTDRLAALNSLNEVVRETTEAVIEQSTREEIERTVCEALAESESYAFAWLGSVARGTDEVYVRQEAGVENYLDGTTISVDENSPASRGPTGRAFRTQEIQVVRDVMNDPAYESWRPNARAHGYQSAAAIPVVHDGVAYGVLNVYAERPDAFADEEQAVIGQLGEVVGHAIAAVERKRALTSDQLIEIDFEIRDAFADFDVPTTDDVITLDQAVPTDDEYLVYGTATESGIETIEAVVESIPHWESVRVVGEDVGRIRFEVRLDEPPVLTAIAALGGYVEHAEIRDGDYAMTIHLPVGTDIRNAIERVRDIYPSVTVRAQRQIDRTENGSNRIVSALNEELTDRQRSVLESAYFSGFFEWPRESSGQEVANSLDIAAPTFSQHIRSAENKIFKALFEQSSLSR